MDSIGCICVCAHICTHIGIVYTYVHINVCIHLRMTVEEEIVNLGEEQLDGGDRSGVDSVLMYEVLK